MIKTGKKLVCILLVVSLLFADTCFMNSHNITAEAASGTQATVFKSMTNAQIIAKVGKICQKDMKKTGILASVTIAQFILESGFGKSKLTQKSNNCFGIKGSLSGSNWTGSTWDGKSLYTIRTKEEFSAGVFTFITANFRKYSSVEQSIADHSAYLRYCKNGSKKRYAGIVGETNYKKAIKIIKKGGYATGSSYVSDICKIIKKYNLTQYDTGVTISDSGASGSSNGTASGSSGSSLTGSFEETTSGSSNGSASGSSKGSSKKSSKSSSSWSTKTTSSGSSKGSASGSSK